MRRAALALQRPVRSQLVAASLRVSRSCLPRVYCEIMDPSEPLPEAARAELHGLVDEYRTRCLWFLRSDLYPETREGALRVLRHIERHGDRAGFRRAARIRRWLSQTSSEPSAAS